MIKVLEVPDFHFSPATLEINKQNAESVRLSAVEHAVDMIFLPGDLTHAHLYATEKGGYNELRKIVASWAAECPVVAVEGTPSHDGPGCYDGLDVTLLQPGKVYGYDRALGVSENPMFTPDALLFGFPEANKKTIQARLALSAEEANGTAEELLKAYVYQTVAPLRAMHPDIPAFGLFHGNISDRDRANEKDMILSSSDIVARVEWFADAGINRLSCGHIHLPKDYGTAGYAGSWGRDWNETGFVPGFNLWDDGVITRIPYGTPKRLKITQAEQATESGVAYWLETKDPAAALPDHVHPWSRITYAEDVRESRRVTTEEAAEARSLWDLALLFDPKTPAKLKPLFDEIGIKIPDAQPDPARVVLQSVTVAGCVLFKGKDIILDLTSITDGLTALCGGNGAGKSSLLSFCTPYPLVVGKDTDSGRDSAIKEFFNQKGAKIEKRILFNGEEHHHLITIKAAHTKSAKVECFLAIDGVSQLEGGTFDEMMAKCEELYGAFEDYRATSFYEQPQQSRNQSSGLMSATKTTARDLVLGISGIDREREKRYALDRKKEHDDKLIPLSARIEAIAENIGDEAEIKAQIASDHAWLKKQAVDVEKKADELAAAEALVRKLSADVAGEDEKRRKLAELRGQHEGLKIKAEVINDEINALLKLAESLPELKQNLAIDDKERARDAENEKERLAHKEKVLKIREGNAELKIRHDLAVEAARDEWRIKTDAIREANQKRQSDYFAKMADYRQTVAAKEEQDRRIAALKSAIETTANPCPQCGFIAPDIAEKIEGYKAELAAMNPVHVPTEPNREPDEIAPLVAKIQAPSYLAEPPEPFFIPAQVASAEDRQELEEKIRKAGNATALIAEKENTLAHVQGAADAAWSRISEIKIDDGLKQQLADAVIGGGYSKTRYDEAKAAADTVTAKIAQAEAELERIARATGQIKELEIERDAADGSAKDWDAVARLLGSDKIPALELDMVLDSIDAEATRCIVPFRESRYSYKTQTQVMGQKGLVDRFDILIHDSATGEYRSFFKHSPGEKAFFNDAYIKALIRKRNEKALREYSPIISDEADGPIEPGMVAAYYEIQNRYFSGQKVLIVSHAPDAQNYVQNSVDVEALKESR